MGVLSTKILALVLNETLTHPRGYQHGWHTDTKTVKSESDVLSILSRFGVGEIVTCWDAYGGCNVVSEAAVLVKGQNEKRSVPLR